jgi:hypothetical protein
MVAPWAHQQVRVLDELLAAIRGAGGDFSLSGRVLARRIAGILSREEPEDVPSFAAAIAVDEGLALLVHGDVAATIHGQDGAETISGRQVATWIDRILDTPFQSLQLSPAAESFVAPDDRYQLEAGAIPAGTVIAVPDVPQAPTGLAVMDSTSTELEKPTPAPIEGDPDDGTDLMLDVGKVLIDSANGRANISGRPSTSAAGGAPELQSFRAISLREGLVETRLPLPLVTDPPREESVGERPVIVDGIACSRGHFNHQDARFCRQCGISMVHKTHEVVRGPRPPLGVLLFDDGMTFSLDTDVVIGRDPGSDASVHLHQARPLAVADVERSLSRIHAWILLNGWDVRVLDKGSANGTYVLLPAEVGWQRLVPEVPITIEPGTTVRLGKRTFRFEAHHQP